MIEAALLSVGVEIRTIADYIAGSVFKLFKLHGSMDWGREVDTPIADLAARDIWSIVHELISRADQLEISDRYRKVVGTPISKDGGPSALFPAIALPVETKRGYECPEAHLESLRAMLPKVTRILVVGWRATERHFLTDLKAGLHAKVSICVVSDTRESAEETIGRIIGAGIAAQPTSAGIGFSQYVTSRGAEQFFGI